jgi:hypothetical protein
MSRDLLSLLQPWSCPLSTKSEDYLSVWGCRWWEDIKNVFSVKKNHFTKQISKRFASYRHFVTGVVRVSPVLWYFRYIASIFLTRHKCPWFMKQHGNIGAGGQLFRLTGDLVLISLRLRL